MGDHTRIAASLAMNVLVMLCFIGLLGVVVYACGANLACSDACHPSISRMISAECHCAVEGGWMLSEEPSKEVSE